MDTRIYVMAHKKFEPPKDDLYIPLHVGRALGDDLGYTCDNKGDNISEKNKNYCELTGIYWIWKNISCDIVGICHYRRYFTKDKKLLSKNYIEQMLKSHDIIVSTSSLTHHKNLTEHYSAVHKITDLEICRGELEEIYPEYLDSFDLCMNCNLFTLGNMMIARKSLFDDYCSWLFEVLSAIEARVNISDYDTFQARIYGYLSERLLRVWIMHNGYKVREEVVTLIE